jgi:RimJ/RimL family protein N-acetyltransferase
MSKRTKNAPYKNSLRLAYRLLNASDEALYAQLYADPEVMRHVGTPLPREKALVSFGKAIALTEQAIFQRRVTAITERSSGKVIGISSIHLVEGKKRTAQVGSMLTPAAQAKGYGPEYSKTLIAYAFKSRPIDRVIAAVAIGNEVTNGLVTDLGFVRGAETPAASDRPAYATWTLSRGKWRKHNKPARKPTSKPTRK